jgi:hypothetical protein
MADQINVNADDRAVAPKKQGASRWGRRLLTMLVATAAVGGFAVVVVYSYDKGKMAGNEGSVPIISAQSGPTKMRPKEPGGMVVPNRDKQVYGRLNVAERPPKVERLLPPPETVVRRPPPPVPASRVAAMSGKSMEQAAKKLAAIEPAAGNPMAKIPAAPPVKSTAVIKDSSKGNGADKKPMKTAKLATQPKKATKTSSSVYRVQLASVRSQKAAAQAWGRHKFDHAELFGKLEPKIVRVELKGKGTYYRLQAGPLPNAAAARSLCSQAKKRKIGCILVRP